MPVERIASTQTGALAVPDRDTFSAIMRGAKLRCPACGESALYSSYLKVSERCGGCGEELHHHRADDAPPYFVILILGHIIVGLVLSVEVAFQPPLWVHAALWLPATLGLALVLLPPIKGALVGLQWALRMHGFGDGGDSPQRDYASNDGMTSDERP